MAAPSQDRSSAGFFQKRGGPSRRVKQFVGSLGVLAEDDDLDGADSGASARRGSHTG